MDRVFAKFLAAIRGAGFILLPEAVATEDLIILLENAVASFPYPRQPIYDFDPISGWDFQLTLLEEKILVGLMVDSWIDANVNSVDWVTAEMTTSEIKTFSKANQLAAIGKWQKSKEIALRKDIMLYHSTDNSYQPNYYELGGDGKRG